MKLTPDIEPTDEEIMADDLDNAAPYDLGWEL